MFDTRVVTIRGAVRMLKFFVLLENQMVRTGLVIGINATIYKINVHGPLDGLLSIRGYPW